MKKIILTACLLSIFTASANAASTGSAIIPHFAIGGFDYGMYLHVSNVSDSSADVTLDLFEKDGSKLLDDGSSSTGVVRGFVNASVTNYVEDTNSTVKFTLPAQTTYILSLVETNHRYGHGKISWSQSGAAINSLVVQGTVFSRTTTSQNHHSYSVVVNGGMPF